MVLSEDDRNKKEAITACFLSCWEHTRVYRAAQPPASLARRPGQRPRHDAMPSTFKRNTRSKPSSPRFDFFPLSAAAHCIPIIPLPATMSDQTEEGTETSEERLQWLRDHGVTVETPEERAQAKTVR